MVRGCARVKAPALIISELLLSLLLVANESKILLLILLLGVRGSLDEIFKIGKSLEISAIPF